MNAEATLNDDGSATFGDSPPVDTGGGDDAPFEDVPPMDEEAMKDVAKGIDPAIYLLLSVLVAAALYYYFVYNKKSAANEDSFFSSLDGDKVRLFFRRGQPREFLSTPAFFAPFVLNVVSSLISNFQQKLMNTMTSRKSVKPRAGCLVRAPVQRLTQTDRVASSLRH